MNLPTSTFTLHRPITAPERIMQNSRKTRFSAWSSRFIGFCLAVALVGVSTAKAAAKPPVVELENLRIGFQERFEVGRWTPCWLQIKAGEDGFKGVVEFSVPDDQDTATSTFRAVDIPANQSVTINMYFRCGSPGVEAWSVKAVDERGRAYSLKIPDESLSPIAPLAPNELLIVTFGSTPGIEGLSALPGFRGENPGEPEGPNSTQIPKTQVGPTLAASGSLQGRPLVLAPMSNLSLLPTRWYGYETATVVVVNTNNKDVMAALGAGKGEPLVEWVRNGGHLVVSIGSNWQAVNDSILAQLLPAKPKGTTQATDLSALETYANAKTPILPPGGPPVTVVDFEPVASRGGRSLDNDSTNRVVYRGFFGFGRVTVIGLNVDEKPFASWSDRNLFWLAALNLEYYAKTNATVGGPTYNPSLRSFEVNDVSTTLHSRLEQFPAVKLVPFGWVAFFIFLYILLIGPGDYFFLRKVLKRMELTWITFPTIVAVVSLIAYTAAYAIKGADLRINKIDAVDVDQSSDPEVASKLVRGATFFTMFSPRNDDYSLEMNLLAFDKDPASTNPGKAKVGAGAERILTWFGVPESNFGGMNSRGRWSPFSRGYAYQPMGEMDSLVGVRVPIWSTKSFIGRWTDRVAPVVESDVSRGTAGQAEGSIKNLLPRTLENAVLVFGNQVYTLGAIEPGKAVVVKDSKRRGLPLYIQEQAQAGTNLSSQDDHAASRASLIRAVWFYTNSGTDPVAFSNSQFRSLDLSGQLALDRPMLLAELAGPLVEVDLGKSAAKPTIEQKTLLRVILPLARSTDGAMLLDPVPALESPGDSPGISSSSLSSVNKETKP